MALFTTDEAARLKGPHIGRGWFAEIQLASGTWYLHNGVGTVTHAEHDWRGVSDPLGGTLAAVEEAEEDRFGQAVAVRVLLAGVNAAFWASVKLEARGMEGRPAKLYWALIDPEDGTIGIFKSLFPMGCRISTPRLHHEGIGTRYVAITFEGFWQSQNYPFGGRWNDADQRRRFPGDKGLQYAGSDVHEQWR